MNLTLLCLLAAFAPLRAGHAQTPPASLAASTLQVDIPAGPLANVLNQFAQATDVSLSFDASLLAGKESAGLRGSFDVETGFRRILQDSGFEAVSYTHLDVYKRQCSACAITRNVRPSRLKSFTYADPR